MAFSPAVKAKALTAAGRSCCICHKFGGIKVECHHIVQEAEGGSNKLDNCIPVCFDCHADMRSYDAKHPRGTKYSAAELREHRDRWYAKVAQSGGPNVATDHVVVDREVYRQFKEQVPYFPVFDYLKERNFAGFGFELDPLEPLFKYCHYSDQPENEFVDAELESARGAFVSAARRFSLAIGQHTFPLKGAGRRMNSVPEEWELTQRGRFDKAVNEIHTAANDVEAAYTNLVRLARRRLGTP